MFCFNIKENIEFLKINFFNNQSPKFIPVSNQNENFSIINLKKFICEDRNPDDEIFDISNIKKIRQNCVFICGFLYPKTTNFHNKDSININIFLEYTYDNSKGIINDIKVTNFYDTFYPDDIYKFQTKPILETIYLNYQE